MLSFKRHGQGLLTANDRCSLVEEDFPLGKRALDWNRLCVLFSDAGFVIVGCCLEEISTWVQSVNGWKGEKRRN